MFSISDLPNLIGWIYGILPTILFTWYVWYSRGEPWRYSVLLSGIALVLVGVYMAGLFLDLMAYLEESKELGKLKTENDIDIFKALKSSGAIWLAALPPIAGGLGVNFISEFMLSKKPVNNA